MSQGKPRREWWIGGALAVLAAVGLTSYCGGGDGKLDGAVSASRPASGYSRDTFGPAWFDADRNGCGTRDDVLTRDLTDVRTLPRKCTVMSGVLDDPYTGTTVQFARGASKVDIDHIFSLADAWDSGASSWSLEQRIMFANDPLNLKAVSSSANRAKGSRGPSTWLPSYGQCEYVLLYNAVAVKYNLRVSQQDAEAIDRVKESQACKNGGRATGT